MTRRPRTSTRSATAGSLANRSLPARSLASVLLATVSVATLPLVTLTGCGGSDSPPPRAPGATQDSPARPADSAAPPASSVSSEPTAGTPATGPPGAVHGLVRHPDPAPERRELRITTDAWLCGQHPVLSEQLVVSPKGGIGNVVAALAGPGIAPTDLPPGGEPPLLDQKNCVFSPHVLLVRVGERFLIRNSDKVLHNARGVSSTWSAFGDAAPNRGFNLAMPTQGQEIKRKLKSPGRVAIQCDVHSWMGAHVVATPHDKVAVSDADGAFRIDGVPPGPHTLHLWHESLGERSLQVEVVPGETVDVEVDWDPAG